MRRLLASAAAVLIAVAGTVAAVGAADADTAEYTIVFDSASGLVEGADFRVGGVAVGSIDSFDVRKGPRAAVKVKVFDSSFGSLRDDAACRIAQQSLIGEYYIECEPGTTGAVLEAGATIPVANTFSPVQFDLVQNVMRRPYRERLSIILTQLGAGFAARGEDVNETIRRSIPALTETNRVLKILGDNRRTLRRLAADSGRVLKVLGRRRADAGRFIVQGRRLASTTAERRDALAATFRNFPGFLSELTPTMAQLQSASQQLTPALADLRAAAPSATRLLKTLPTFARASEPAIKTLGDASKIGRAAAKEAASTVEALRELGLRSPEPANNLELVLKDLNNRDKAVDKDPDSPGGAGYTGLEALLQYVYDQSLGINIFDARGYILKLSALANECDSYTTAEQAKADPERTARCSQALGPNQPGITTPDPSPPASPADQGRRARERTDPSLATPTPTATPAPSSKPSDPVAPAGPELPKPLQDLLDRLPGPLQGPQVGPAKPLPSQDLLDFLMGT